MNPLVTDYVLPPFDEIQAQHIVPAIELVLKESRSTIEKLTQQENPTWQSLMYALENLDERLSRAWSPVSHLNSVKNTPQMREAYLQAEPKITEYGTWVGQNQDLYQAIHKLKTSDAYATFNNEQKQSLAHALRDFKLAGVALEGEKRQQFAALKQELSQLQTKFEHNIMDATDNWHYDVEDEAMLSGIPQAILQNAKQKAEAAGQKGWRLGIDFPTYFAVITYADNQDLRKTVHKAFATRASTAGPHDAKYDNSDVMQKIVSMRQDVAKLLDFSAYTDYSLERKMANSADEVFEFLQTLANKAKPFAEKEIKTLQAFAKDKFGVDKLEAWDISYYSEKLKHELFDISEEKLRPYFPLDKVLNGMFEIVNRLYGMTIKPHEGVQTWHKDVQFFDIFDQNGKLRGQFYLDPFARANKRGGAWMDEALVRRKKPAGNIQTPVAYLTCNFQPAAEGKPPLLSHGEVTTLFHEFGHGMHHMMTQVEVADVSGINGVAWDAVELPSQFFENWCWQDEAIALISAHYETGEPLPKKDLENLKKAKNFHAGMFLVRQLEFAIFDMRVHNEFNGQADQIQNILNEVREQISVVPTPEYNRFQNSFSHIFAGGYAAGYYSYLWAEVLSCDAFSRFEEEGIFNKDTGRAFLQNILEKGGSEEPAKLFAAFRGRAPNIDALLRHHGLV